MENLKSYIYEEIQPHKRQVKIRDINARLDEQNLGINVTEFLQKTQRYDDKSYFAILQINTTKKNYIISVR